MATGSSGTRQASQDGRKQERQGGKVFSHGQESSAAPSPIRRAYAPPAHSKPPPTVPDDVHEPGRPCPGSYQLIRSARARCRPGPGVSRRARSWAERPIWLVFGARSMRLGRLGGDEVTRSVRCGWGFSLSLHQHASLTRIIYQPFQLHSTSLSERIRLSNWFAPLRRTRPRSPRLRLPAKAPLQLRQQKVSQTWGCCKALQGVASKWET